MFIVPILDMNIVKPVAEIEKTLVAEEKKYVYAF